MTPEPGVFVADEDELAHMLIVVAERHRRKARRLWAETHPELLTLPWEDAA